MKTKATIACVMGVVGLLMAMNSFADISFLISSDFPKAFYCHFKADSVDLLSKNRGGWSSKHHAGSSYHKDGLSLVRVLVSCFDDNAKDHINPMGHICYNAVDNLFGTTVIVSHSGSQILFNGQPPEASRRC